MLLVTDATGAARRPLVDLLGREGAAVLAVTRNPQAAAFGARQEGNR